jgi:hypothetical protein
MLGILTFEFLGSALLVVDSGQGSWIPYAFLCGYDKNEPEPK